MIAFLKMYTQWKIQYDGYGVGRPVNLHKNKLCIEDTYAYIYIYIHIYTYMHIHNYAYKKGPYTVHYRSCRMEATTCLLTYFNTMYAGCCVYCLHSKRCNTPKTSLQNRYEQNSSLYHCITEQFPVSFTMLQVF